MKLIVVDLDDYCEEYVIFYKDIKNIPIPMTKDRIEFVCGKRYFSYYVRSREFRYGENTVEIILYVASEKR